MLISQVIAARDPTAFIIAAIHINLCIGTLSNFIKDRPDLADLLEALLNFDICGEFMLTEVGHGLDVRNLETTATLQPDGFFVSILRTMRQQRPCLQLHRVAASLAWPLCLLV